MVPSKLFSQKTRIAASIAWSSSKLRGRPFVACSIRQSSPFLNSTQSRVEKAQEDFCIHHACSTSVRYVQNSTPRRFCLQRNRKFAVLRHVKRNGTATHNNCGEEDEGVANFPSNEIRKTRNSFRQVRRVRFSGRFSPFSRRVALSVPVMENQLPRSNHFITHRRLNHGRRFCRRRS